MTSSYGSQAASYWQEYESVDGRRYYYNMVTKQSSWEKPIELMTPLVRADASTVWKEFTTPEGKKYYYNKETKQSKWTIPDELKGADASTVWKEFTTPEGRKYYYNKETKQSKWTIPDELKLARVEIAAAVQTITYGTPVELPASAVNMTCSTTLTASSRQQGLVQMVRGLFLKNNDTGSNPSNHLGVCVLGKKTKTKLE